MYRDKKVLLHIPKYIDCNGEPYYNILFTQLLGSNRDVDNLKKCFRFSVRFTNLKCRAQKPQHVSRNGYSSAKLPLIGFQKFFFCFQYQLGYPIFP